MVQSWDPITGGHYGDCSFWHLHIGSALISMGSCLFPSSIKRDMCAVQFYFYYNILCSAGSACVGVWPSRRSVVMDVLTKKTDRCVCLMRRWCDPANMLRPREVAGQHPAAGVCDTEHEYTHTDTLKRWKGFIKSHSCELSSGDVLISEVSHMDQLTR